MSAILDVPGIREQVYRWTVADYRALAEDNPAYDHAELIRGIILRKEEETPPLFFLRDLAAEVLRNAVRGPSQVWQKPSLVLADSVAEPDVAVVRGEKGQFRHEHPTTAELVVEIAGTSRTLDREKAALYAEAGVSEYWIVLAEAGQVEAYRRPEGGGYRERRLYGRGKIIEGIGVTDGGSVAVETLFA